MSRRAVRRSINTFYSQGTSRASTPARRSLTVPSQALRTLEIIRREAQRRVAAAARARAMERLSLSALVLGSRAQRSLDRAQRVQRSVALLARNERRRLVQTSAATSTSSYFAPHSKAAKRMAELYDPNHSPEYRTMLEECVKRKMRQEVMFAKNVAGASGLSRHRDWKESSNVRC